MPGRRRTGPYGGGPRTGWGGGDCAGADDTRPWGGGRGWRGGGGHRWRHRLWAVGEPGWRGHGRRWDDAQAVREVESLQAHQRDLERELTVVRERLAAIGTPGDATSRDDE